MNNDKDIFMDHMSHFITFDDGTSPPPPGFAKIVSPLTVIIETHLWVEAKLIRLVERNLLRPEELQLSKQGFDRLTRLAAALGVVSLEEKPGLTELNRLRNKFAHNINWQPARENVMALYDALTPEQKSIPGKIPLPAELNHLIVHVACLLSAHFTQMAA